MTPPDETPRFTADESVPRGSEGTNGGGGASATPPPLEDRPKTRGPGMRKLETQLREFYETIAVIAVTPFDPLAGTLMHQRADELASAWIDLAERDARVKRTLERLMEVSGWGGVVAVHAAILIPVIANRGLLPDTIASGAATLTIMQNPEVAPLFTHERWRTQPAPGQNGNGSAHTA